MLYSLDRRDVDKTLAGIALAAEVLLAAGAREVHTLLPGLPPVRSRADLRNVADGRWRAGDLKLSAYHPMGTARMGDDPRSSVVDCSGRSHDVAGLWIADASILPGSTYVNPQITIMALATRVGRALADSL
jgi:choline dehydrogenase-like flavoprotein